MAGNANLWTSAPRRLVDHSEFGSSGFTAVPGGYRNTTDGGYTNMGSNGYFWSATELHSSTAWYRELSYYSSDVARVLYNKKDGFSVRLVRN